jgi:head-tail adaptor
MFHKISELRESISFLEPKARRATSSGYIPADYTTWVEGVRAKIEVTGATEQTVGGGTLHVITGTITIRYRSDRNPTSTHKVIWGDKVLNINGVRDPNGRIRQLELDFTQAV